MIRSVTFTDAGVYICTNGRFMISEGDPATMNVTITRMCVCVCVCMCMYVYVCVVCVVYVSVVCVCVSVCVSLCVCVWVCVWVCVCGAYNRWITTCVNNVWLDFNRLIHCNSFR